MAVDGDNRLLTWFDRHFSIRLPVVRFASNTILLSLAGLLPVLGLYISLVPDFWSHLLGSQAALSRFLRQILTNGLPVVFVVNALGLVLFAQSRANALRASAALVIDFVARIAVFTALHAAIYFASAQMFGSFGGDPLQALRVIGPTLAQAAAFGNLSGVYLYATLVSALPLHIALAESVLRRRGYGPRSAPWLALAPALAVVAIQFLVLTAAARALSEFG
jgi:hypothetical protein